MVEGHGEVSTREYMMTCFTSLFENTSNIPVGILVEPLVK
jgi:hypothetical protein